MLHFVKVDLKVMPPLDGPVGLNVNFTLTSVKKKKKKHFQIFLLEHKKLLSANARTEALGILLIKVNS